MALHHTTSSVPQPGNISLFHLVICKHQCSSIQSYTLAFCSFGLFEINFHSMISLSDIFYLLLSLSNQGYWSSFVVLFAL